MRYQVRKRTSILAVVAGAALLIVSGNAFAGTPTLGSGCGASATIAGNDNAGKVTLGSSNTLCTITFSTVFNNAPACMAMNETNGGAHATAAATKTTPATLTFDAAAPWADGDTISYICQGY